MDVLPSGVYSRVGTAVTDGLAGYPETGTDGTWRATLDSVVGIQSATEAADAGVERFVSAVSTHLVGTFEGENAPETHSSGHGVAVDHTDPLRAVFGGRVEAFSGGRA